jgi:selenocysteine lyase/cysteine desulfurase
MELARLLAEGFLALDGVRVYCAGWDERHLPVVLCNVDNLEAGEVGTILDVQYDIAVRTGLHCAPLAHEGIGTAPLGAVRFSVGPFNVRADIDAALAAMREVTVTFAAKGRRQA